MKVKFFMVSVGQGKVDEEINSFIKDKNVADVKMLESHKLDKDANSILHVLILYKD